MDEDQSLNTLGWTAVDEDQVCKPTAHKGESGSRSDVVFLVWMTRNTLAWLMSLLGSAPASKDERFKGMQKKIFL